MATLIRKTSPEVDLWVAAHNDLKAQIGAGANFHLDKSERSLVSASASDLPTLLVRTNELINVFTFHFADTLAHKVAAASSLPAQNAAVDLASAITALNLMKASHNTECASTARHYNADASNTTTSANATDLASSITLANELFTDLGNHMASAPAAASLRISPM